MTSYDLAVEPDSTLTRWVGVASAILLLVSAVQAGATDTAWKLYDRDLERPVARFAGGPHQISCGSYGVFDLEFGPAALTNGSTRALPTREEGQEVPPDFPLLTAPAPLALSKDSPGNQGKGRKSSIQPVATTPPLPCTGGRCFSHPGDSPWIAVVDWNNWHGWTVGQTILTASEGTVKASLFPVDDPRLMPYFGERVTDVHLLAQLCSVAELMEAPGISPPVAVSMSLGRAHGPHDGSAATCDPSFLACQISRVLTHLQTRSRELAPERANATIFLAAAGNHGDLLFPASHEAVISVGALDLQVFHKSGGALPAWESPVAADALFPGHGLCLEYSTPTGQHAAWPAPPGASYATAMMTGWLAPALDTQPLPQGRGRWAPARFCRGRNCSFAATQGGRAYGKTGKGAQGLTEGTSSDRESLCAPYGTGDEVTLTATVGTPRPWTQLPRLSLPQAVPSLVLPSPTPASCVPCEERQRLNRGQGKVSGGLGSPGTDLGSTEDRRLDGALDGELTARAETARKIRSDSLAIHLWAGQPLDRSLVLADLFLRVDQLLLPVSLTRRDLHRLESGEIDVLEINLGRVSLSKQTQPSLIWSLRGSHAGGGELAFWTSTPILLRSSK